MKVKKIFSAFSAVVLLAVSSLCGCADNSGTVNETTERNASSAVTDIAVFTTKAPFDENVNTTKAVTSKISKTTTKKKNSSGKKSSSKTTTAVTTAESSVFDSGDGTYVEYHFRSKKQLTEHFDKHGGEFSKDFDYKTAKEYEKGASDVVNDPEALHKTEAEDGDGVYYLEDTNEFVILSTDGYLRTYFRPSGGKSYYDRQ